MASDEKICFVIMPFSKTNAAHTEEYWMGHFDSFLKPAIEGCTGVKAYRSKPLHTEILNEIITNLYTAPVVVADITDHNPNVFWELGIRETLKHGTVVIAEKGTEIPFDIKTKSVLLYWPERISNSSFITNLQAAIKDCISNPSRPDSVVIETLGGRGSMFQIIRKEEVQRRIDALLSECNYNIALLNIISEFAEQNKPILKWEKRFPTHKLRTNAIEFLITHRYLDENIEFYTVAEGICDIIQGANSQISDWHIDMKGVGNWFIKNENLYKTNFEHYKTMLLLTKQKI
jgi:hypothetical protein